MTRWHHRRQGSGHARWRCVSPASLALGLLLVAAQVQQGKAAIVNEAVGFGSHDGAIVRSGVSRISVPVTAASPGMTVTQTGVLNDDDGVPGLSAGDSISYEVTVTNTGNNSLTGVSLFDPSVTLAHRSGDSNGDGKINAGETWTYVGTYALTQSDLDTNGAGDGDIDSSVTVFCDQLPDQTASAEVPISPVAALLLKKTLDVASNSVPNHYDLEFLLLVRNTGQVTLSSIEVDDDIAGAVSPAVLTSLPVVSLSGFTGAGAANPGYDGGTTTGLLSGDVRLLPGQTGEIRISLSIDTGGQSVAGLNTAVANAAQLADRVSSDDPTVTPGNSGDINPTPISLVDTDGDGSPDSKESEQLDRDGDGIADARDYDPTGYFYCEGDGRIVSGGSILVENLTTGGSQTGVGSSSGVTILRDGSDGRYQFSFNMAGKYRLSFVQPPGTLPSTSRHARPTLETSELPSNPASLGSGEFGATAYLADSSAGANPFHLEFDFAPGDPVLFNNNIPLRHCGTPQINAEMGITSGPVLQLDGRAQLTYALTATNAGTEAVNEVRIADDLGSVFGVGNSEIASISITSSPAGFGAAANPFFDGTDDIGILTSGGTLPPGEAVVIELSLLISSTSGTYVNAMAASGLSPIDNSPVGPDTANIATTINTIPGPADLVASNTANSEAVVPGQSATYTLTITNPQDVSRGGVNIVDQMPAGFSYVSGSARVDGAPAEPTTSSRELSWSGLTIPANGSVTVTVLLVAGATADGPNFVNRMFARDEVSGAIISNIAEAVVQLENELVSDCSEIIGHVFDDRNRDGLFQEGESGLVGVRLETVAVSPVTTDSAGTYHITCAMIPASNIGSDFVVKLDERSLPAGFAVTTENPKIVRLTRGKTANLNFGAVATQALELDLDENSFEPGGATLKRASLEKIDRILTDLEGKNAVLKITYAERPGGILSQERIDLLTLLVRRVWELRGGGGELEIETRIVKSGK